MRTLLRHDKARIVALVTLVGVALVVPLAAHSHQSANERLLHTLGMGLSMQGEPGSVARPRAGVADRANPPPRKTKKPEAAPFDEGAQRRLRRPKAPEHRDQARTTGAPGAWRAQGVAGADPDATLAAPTGALPAQLDQRTMRKSSASASAAPPPLTTFEGLDFANWGAGHPPDTNGDVGPTYYIQTINTSIGIYDKSTGNRVAAFTFDAFMSQGSFGNLCDTDNFGDPVVLYDSFEDRWFITDFAFKLDGARQRQPAERLPVLRRLEDGRSRRAAAGTSIRSRLPAGSATTRSSASGPTASTCRRTCSATARLFLHRLPRVGDQQAADVCGRAARAGRRLRGDASDFTVIPANARLQAGTPPAGTPEYFVSTWQYLNALSIYKFKVDWDKVSTSTFTGPELSSRQPVGRTRASRMHRLRRTASTRSRSARWLRPVLEHRRRRVALGLAYGASRRKRDQHELQRTTTGNARALVPGERHRRHRRGEHHPGDSFDPDGANTFFRFMPSLAVDRVGDMAIGYSKSNSTTNPQIKYAGRLAGDQSTRSVRPSRR